MSNGINESEKKSRERGALTPNPLAVHADEWTVEHLVGGEWVNWANGHAMPKWSAENLIAGFIAVASPGDIAAMPERWRVVQLDAYDQHGRPAPGYAERLAVEFNARVWGSAEMTAAVLACADAHSELVTGKGWGLLALGNAEGQLLKALGMIRAMKGWR